MTMTDLTTGSASICSTSTKQQSVADQSPCNHDPKIWEVSKDFGFKFSCTPSEALFGLRFLISKELYERKELTAEDLYLGTLFSEKLETVKDQSFLRKWKTLIDKVNEFFFTLRGPRAKTLRWLIRGTMYHPEKEKFLSVVLSPHAFFGRKKFFNVKNFVRKVNRLKNRKPSTTRFLGVGYKDHGTARDVAWDGSPSWQELAQVLSQTDYSFDRDQFRIRLSNWHLMNFKKDWEPSQYLSSFSD